MIEFAASLLAAALASGQAPPPVPPPPVTQAPHVITAPKFESVPTADQFARFYPERARRARITGAVLIRCAVTELGALTACQVLAEDPPGYDFGAAAIKMAGFFKLAPTPYGQPAAFTTRIRFALSP